MIRYSIILCLSVVLFVSCDTTTSKASSSAVNGQSEGNPEETPEAGVQENDRTTGGVKDTRFKFNGMLSNRNVELILNAAVIPIGSFTDFYLKVADVENVNITVSTNTKEGLVSKNKEPYYFGAKAVEGANEVVLTILEKRGEERVPLGSITIPTNLKQ